MKNLREKLKRKISPKSATVEKQNETKKIKIISPPNGAIVSQNNDKIQAFVKNYLRWSSFNELTKSAEEQYFPKFVQIKWKGERGGEYVVMVSEDENFVDAREYECNGTSAELQNLLCGRKYYYQVKSKWGGASEVCSFVTAREPRIIKIDGLSNTRDVGGYVVYSNGSAGEKPVGRVKQGRIYRGANPDGITEIGQTAINRLGIKTILDLREKNNRKQAVNNVGYIELPPCGGPCYVNGGMGVEEEKYLASLVCEIKAFADEKNYPVYMHCQIGRDRTGTLAFMLNALLGVSYKDLTLDYELSIFSESGRIDYDDYEKMRINITAAFESLYAFFIGNAQERNTEKSLKYGVEAFLKDKGVTAEELKNIRDILIEQNDL